MPPEPKITDRALDLFAAMGRLRCTCPPPRPLAGGPCPGCAAWFDLHAELHDELKLKPWQWPCVARQSPKRAGSHALNNEISVRMAMLDAAAKARRTAPSEKEGSPDAEPVAGEDTPV